ncbi:MAG: TIGR03984 family CRISPR-associated protein [Schwartzia sp.]|nr:TIGR03984 family CRISPR-associated protein [Schwartzia sp. (in: firmicutes)]
MSEKLATIEKTNGVIDPNVHIEATPEALEAELKKHGLLRGIAVVWQMQSVLWGRAEDGRLSFSDGGSLTPEYWQELRIFNEDAELHLTRRGGVLFGRFRSDIGGDKAFEYVETSSPLWGVRDENQNGVPDGYVRLRDDGRGIEMIVPCGDVNAEQYGLVTRNYIEADEDTKQAGYTDYRFVRIADARRKGE